ncbi:MAG: hypothetical protein IKU38_06400, partial [Clostridia bacterium]|nr:hypothetical protein [Clostridia bacterium]
MGKTKWMRLLMVFVCLMLVCTCVLAEDCVHPEEKQAFRYSDWEDVECVNNNDGRTHVATYINPFEMWQCTDCGTMLRRDLTMDPVTEPHAFARGECECGAVEEDTNCVHANSTYDHEGSFGEREFVSLNAEQHQKSYTPLDVYVCNDCGCMYDRVGEYKTVTEAHMFRDGVCRYCQAVAAAAEYTLTYTFENDPFGRFMYTTPVMSGTVVTLDVPVGEVAENQETGDMARLKSWTEDVPTNAQPVQFSTSEDQWGNTAYSFTMPARNVIVHGVWETVYSVVYVDNAWNCDDKFEDEWHMVAYGEPTPPYNGGEEPYHEGYWFAGWRPEIAETVTENARYAAWFGLNGEDCAHFDFHCTSEYETRLPEGSSWMPNNMGQHVANVWAGAVYVCDECGKELLDGSESVRAYDCYDGEDEDDFCDTCGGCMHMNTTPTDSVVYLPAEGERWYSEGWGYHYGNAIPYAVCCCNDCQGEVYVAQSDEPVWVSKEDCYTNDGDIWCDACGWAVCSHENCEPKDEYVQWDGDAYWIGNGHHAVMARLGQEYYCPDCDTHLFDAYENFREYTYDCFDGDDEDTQCDQCGADCWCSHYNTSEWFWIYPCEDNQDNGDGTHTGMGYELYGYNCYDCEDFIGSRTHDEKREYTMPHGYDENGVCNDCGAVKPECEHANAQPTGESIQTNPWWEDRGDGTHTRWYHEFNTYSCPDCETVYKVLDETRYCTVEPHTMENGACVVCGAPACAHENKELQAQNEFYEYPDTNWSSNGWGQHERVGAMYNVYFCHDCGWTVREMIGEPGLKQFDCYDGDGDNICDTCWWYICDHPGMGVADDHHYELMYGENWRWVSNGHHAANCYVGNWYWCELCQQGIFEPTGEEYITEGCWNHDDDDRCDGCGAEMCRHENRQEHGDWYSPAEGENWQHVGWGHHGANCNVGIGFYCYDCQENYAETHYQEYIVEQCWEGDNLDDTCDGCGCGFGEGWGSCNHENRTENFIHYSVNEDGWKDNEDGTHNGMAIEVEGYNCNDCGNFFGRPIHDDYRLYTVQHSLNWDEQKCWECGVDMNQCWHDEHIRTETTLIKNTRYESNEDGTHMRIDRLLDLCICQMEGCGEQFYLDSMKGEALSVESHTFGEDGWCVCGAKDCDHSDLSKLRLEEEDMIRLLWGTGWECTGRNTHTGTGTKYDRYFCDECQQTLLVPVNGTGETEDFEIDCFSRDDGDGWCDDCGWYFACENHNPQVENPEHYELRDGEEWHSIGNNQHEGWCDKGTWYHCYGCDQGWFADPVEFDVKFIGGCWDDENNPDGHCDGCHGEMVTCQHEHTSDWHTGFETGPWTDNGNETHSATGWELWGFDCYDCNEFIGERTHDDERTFTFDHGYDENGNCHCGAVWTCDHENATRNENRGKNFNTVAEDMFDGRHVRWFDVYHEFTCNDCDAVFLRYMERGEEIEKHHFENGECVACGAPECEHDDAKLVRQYAVILEAGHGWHQDTHGNHYGFGEMGDIYYCDACDHRVYERHANQEPRYLSEACFDNDENGHCDECGWTFCEHPEGELEHLEDGFHSCVEDEGWYYVGDGQHRAVCEVGKYYYCHACDQHVFVKEVDAKEYTYPCGDGNGDERCDACGAYVAPCPHYERTDNFYHYAGEYRDNGNGTHTGMGHEMYGFWCHDCGNYIADVTHEEAREYTKEHNFNEDGVCDADGCGAVYSGCDHEDATFNNKGKNYNVIFEDLHNGEHIRWFDVFREFTCNNPDCGAVFMRYIERGEAVEAHNFREGQCVHCGAPECQHEDPTLVRENVVILEPGRDWRWNTNGSHTGYGVYGDIYACGECGYTIYDRYEGEEPRYLTEDCSDEDNNGHCDVCHWTFCEHGSKEFLEENFHHCVEDEQWYYVGNYQHSAVCEVGDWYFCHDCGEHVFDKKVDAQLYTYGCWDDNFDGRCDACGAESCRHEDIDVKDDRHYQPARGHEWEENWYGQHGAWCDVGIWFYCKDCKQEGFRRDYQDYVVEQCWEGGNQDNRCDGCGHEYGEKWGTCNHEKNRSQDYNHYELKDGEQWVINDNGTHSGWAIEVWGFQCWDCGTHIAQHKHDDYRWYTVPHSFNEENNTCHDCGAELNPCQHEENTVATGETEVLYAEYYNNDDGTHTVWARLLTMHECLDCGEIFACDQGAETVYTEAHTFEDGKCIHCAYPQCDHSDLSKLTLENEDWVRPVWGAEWESNGTGKHVCMGVMYDRYVCDECGWAWLVPVDGTEAKYYEDGCYDDNDDNHCDECGWFFCDHENSYVKNEEHYEPVAGAHWQPSGNGRHIAICNVGYWYHCDDCGQGWFADVYDHDVEFEGWCWDDENRPDGHCDGCGQEMCRHEGNTGPWRNEYHCDWEYFDENLHHGWGYEMHGFECYDCGEFICEPTHEEELEYFNEHHYNEEEGVCWDCGMPMTCGHWDARPNKEAEEQELNVTYEDLFDGTHARWFDVYCEFICNECEETVLKHTDTRCEVEEHTGNNEVVCPCGWAGCKHEYTEENLTDANIVRPAAGYSFHGEGMGYHWTEKGAVYNVYQCTLCEQPVFEIVGEVQENIRENCFDGDDDNDECDVCGWPVDCAHPDREPREECHWWIENAMPEHIGGGMHEVMAHFGRMYYCPDCDRDFFDAYEGFKLYAFHCEDHNGDGLCDDCRVEMECEHNGDGKEWYYHMVTGPWTDNGNGTHSAEGYRVWGFDCDCDEFIGYPDQANKITFTFEHYYEDGVCHCGVKKTCDHKNITPIDGGDFFNRIYEDLYNGTHNYTFDVFEWTHCNTCGENFMRHLVTEERNGVAHEFEDGVCPCGAIECDHAEKTPVELNEFIMVGGWSSDNLGHHSGKGTYYDRYNCDLCRRTVLIVKEKEQIVTDDCHDDDKDGHCDECGYFFCDHEGAEVVDEENYEPAPGEEWTYIGDGWHSALCNVAVSKYCEKCDQYTYEYYDYNIEHAERCTDDDESGRCDMCGADYVPCEHSDPEKVHVVNPEYYEVAEDPQWEYLGNGTHKVICDVAIEYFCEDCETNYLDFYKYGVTLYEHCVNEDDDTVCDGCGAEMCKHENASDWYLKYVGDYIDNLDGTCTTVNGVELDGFDCEDCKQFIGTPSHEGYRTYTFEHDFVNGVCVRCEAQAGDCMHENAEQVGEEEHINLWIGDWHDGSHIIWYDTLTTYECGICGETFKRVADGEDRTFKFEDHIFENGACTACGAQECAHEEKVAKGETFVMEPNKPWIATGFGTHKVPGTMYAMYICSECGERVYEELWVGYIEEDCWDEDGDGVCDNEECGAELIECEHPEVITRYWTAESESYKDNGDGRTHIATYTGVREIRRCLACGHEVELNLDTEKVTESHAFVDGKCDCGAADTFCAHEDREWNHEVKRDETCIWLNENEHVHSYTKLDVFFCPDCGCTFDIAVGFESVTENHEFDENGECRWCVKADCVHPQDKQKLRYWQGGEVDSYTDHGDSYHTVVYVTATEYYECGVCGERYQVLVEMKEDVQTHKYVDGACACGALDDRCAHENREFRYSDRKDGVYVWLNETAHSANYTVLDMYQCMDCSCYFGESGERVTVDEEAHVLMSETECGYCGPIERCQHENKTEVSPVHYEIAEDADYVANQTGCHIVWATKGALYNCLDCEESVFVPYGEAQGYFFECLDENSDLVCDLCGWNFPNCDHAGHDEEYAHYVGDFTDNGDGTHYGYGTELWGFWCEKCDSYIAKPTHEGLKYFENIPHSWNDEGKCHDCGAVCAHADRSEDFYHYDGEFTDNGDGTHTGYAIKMYGFWCNDCDQYIAENLDEEPQLYENLPHNWEGDGPCEDCGATCAHEDRTDYFYHYDGEFENIGDGMHGGYAIKEYGFWCNDCDRYINEELDEEPQYYELYHEFNEDGVCDADGCGATRDQCAHPEDKQNLVEWFSRSEPSFTDNHDGTHTAVYTNIMEIYECLACGQWGAPQATDETKTEIEYHAYSYDECGCGAIDDGACEHEDAVYRHEGRYGAQYVYYDAAHHETSYISLSVYECPDCHCWFDEEVGPMTILEEHMLKGETECAYCGEFGAIYKLTFQFVNGSDDSGFSKNVKAGETVQLHIGIGEIFENDGNPKRLKSWTENVPAGAAAVAYTSSTDEDGCVWYSFTMPERDVTWTGEWETVYAVVYYDGVDDEEIFDEEWHTCSYGEATPAFNGGKDPVREGYVFMGWDPEVAETVTAHANYYAQWSACAHEHVTQTGETENVNLKFEDRYNGQHALWYNEATICICDDCGETVKRVSEERVFVLEAHTFENGECDCGAKDCAHESKTYVRTMFVLDPNESWEKNGSGKHTGYGTISAIYTCNTCGQTVHEAQTGTLLHEVDCFDSNSDGYCDDCNWFFCDHENFEYTGNASASGILISSEQIAGNDYKHTEHYTKYQEAKCLTCGELFSHVYEESDTEVDHRYANGQCTQCAYRCSHDDQTDYICDACKTDFSCKHKLTEADLVEEYHYKLAKDSQWTPDGKGNHVGTATLGNLYYCGECEKNVFVALDEEKEHSIRCVEDEDTNGLCDVCGGFVDKAAPKFEIIEFVVLPETDTIVEGCDEVMWNLAVSDDVALDHYEIYINNVFVCRGELLGEKYLDCGYSTTVLPAGEYYFEFRIYDIAQKCSKYKVPNPVIVVANEAPVIGDFTSSAGEEFLMGTEVTFSATVTDVGCLSKVEMFIGSKLVKSVNADDKQECVIDYTLTELKTGEHIVRVVATDHQGLTDEESLTVNVICEHQHKKPTDNSWDTLNDCVVIDDYQHMDYFTIYDEMSCPDCGEVFVDEINGTAKQNHTYVSGVCTGCKHACEHPLWNGDVCDACGSGCKHEGWTVKREDYYQLVDGSQWTRVDYNKHTAVCEVGTLYYCEECDNDIFVKLVEAQECTKYCRDNDENLKCDLCNGCMHAEWTDNIENYHKLVGDSVWTPDGNGSHKALCEVGRLETCPMCDESRFVKQVEAQEYVFDCLDANRDGSCDTCGGDMTSCKHKEWTEGVCDACGYVCIHPVDQWDEGCCWVCGETVRDTVPPSVDNVQLTVENGREGSKATYRANVSDDKKLHFYEIHINDKFAAEGDLSGREDVIEFTTDALAAGEYRFKLRLWDQAGHEVIHEYDEALIIVANAAPWISELSSSAGEAFQLGTEAKISVTVSDDFRLAKVELYIDGAVAKSIVMNEPMFMFEYGVGALTAGEHVVRLVVTDNEGMTAEKSLTLTVICEHNWNSNGECGKCGATCGHEDKYLESEVFYQFAKGEDFVSDGEGHHSAVATLGKRYVCNECGGYIFVANEGEVERLHVLDCDTMNEGQCSVCGYCAHSDKKWTGVTTDTLNNRVALDDYKHKDYYTNHDEMECQVCGTIFIENTDKEAERPHDYVDGVCTECQHQCAHPAVNGVECEVCHSNLDKAAPAFVAVSLKPVTGTVGCEVSYYAEVSDDMALARYELYINNLLAKQDDLSGLADAVRFTTTELPVGEYYFTLVVYDTTEKRSENKYATPVVIVDNAPVIGEITSSQGNTFDIGTEVTFSAEVSDDYKLSKIEVYIDGDMMKSVEVSSAFATIDYTVNDLTVGKHVVIVKATDTAGQKTEKSLTVTVECKHVFGDDHICDVCGHGKVAITKDLKDITASLNEKVTLSVAATGEGLTYEWYFSKDGGATWSKSSCTTASYAQTMSAAIDGRQFYCIVRDKDNYTAQSSTATLRLPVPVITKQLEDVEASYGEKVTLSIEATGEGLTYQWYYKDAGATTWSKSSCTAASYSQTMSAMVDGRMLKCEVTNAYGKTVSSEEITLTLVMKELAITKDLTDISAKLNEKVTFSVEATGDGLMYKWFFSKDGGATWSQSSCATASYSQTVSAAVDGRMFYCEVSDVYGDKTVESAKVTLSIDKTPLAITKDLTDVLASLNEKVTLSIEATGDSLTYQWYYKDAGATDWSKSSCTAASYNQTMSESVDGRQLMCKVTDAYNNSVDSYEATLVVKKTQLAITKDLQDVSAKLNEKVTLSVEATGDGLTYAWYFSKDGGATWSKSSCTTASYAQTVSAAVDGRMYKCVVNDMYAGTSEITSNVITLSVDKTLLAITKDLTDISAKLDEKVTFSVEATGDGLMYKWFFSKDGGATWSQSSCTTASYAQTVSAAVDGRMYYCEVSDVYGGEPVESAKVTLSVDKAPLAITKDLTDISAKLNEKVTFSVEATGDGLTYKWFFSKDGGATWSQSSCVTASYTQTVSTAVDGRMYYCEVSDVYDKTVESAKVTLSVDKTPLAITKDLT